MLNLVVGPGEPDNVKFGEILHQFRTNNRFDRAEAARRIGVSSEYIRMVEIGKRSPAAGTALKMLDAYRVPYTITINEPQLTFENISVIFTSRIKESRHSFPTPTRNEMLGEIVSHLVIADDDILKKIRKGLT